MKHCKAGFANLLCSGGYKPLRMAKGHRRSEADDILPEFQSFAFNKQRQAVVLLALVRRLYSCPTQIWNPPPQRRG